MSGVFGFFISYKRKDAEGFVVKVASALKEMKYDVWLDHEEIRPGESILTSIENGVFTESSG
jgi:hypothetical protein